MATATVRATTIGVFSSHEAADRAIAELKKSGYRDDQIGLVAKDASGKTVKTDGAGHTHAGEGAAIGAATGAGAAALVSLGLSFGVIPVIGPILAVGPLAAALISAAGGAAAASIAGALIGLGIPEEDAKYYEGEVKAGKYLVTVDRGDRDGRRDEEEDRQDRAPRCRPETGKLFSKWSIPRSPLPLQHKAIQRTTRSLKPSFTDSLIDGLSNNAHPGVTNFRYLSCRTTR